ncbi:MAG: hypothetical protein WDW36_008293 [Sanguina aurantia]
MDRPHAAPRMSPARRHAAAVPCGDSRTRIHEPPPPPPPGGLGPDRLAPRRPTCRRSYASSSASDDSSSAPSTSPSSSSSSPPCSPPPPGPKIRKRKAAPSDDGTGEGDVEIRFPAHKFILVGMSELFSTRLETALGETPATSLRLYAESLMELYAMEAVVELIYANRDKLPAFCTAEVDVASGGSLSRLQRLVCTLTVSDQWQAPFCLAACSSAICTLPAAGMTWDDCSSLFTLSEALTQQPEASGIPAFACSLAVHLAATASSVPPPMPVDPLSVHLRRLPVSVRWAVFTSVTVGFNALRCLLGSNDMIAESEDHLAIELNRRLCHGSPTFSPAERVELRNLLRYQHMSSTFLGLKLPHMPHLQLTAALWPQLTYLRGLPGFDRIPAEHRLTTVPSAWYKRPRRQAASPPHSVELTLRISRSDLEGQLAATAAYQAGGAAPPTLSGGAEALRGVAWTLNLGSPNGVFQLLVRPTRKDPGSRANVALEKAGVFAKLTFHLQAVSTPIHYQCSAWIGSPGWGPAHFFQQQGGRKGDLMDLAWWQDYIIDEHLRFTATVTMP